MAPIIPTDQTDAAPPERGSKGLVFLAGAIKWWWQATCLRCGHWDEPHYMEGQYCPAQPDQNHDLYVWWDSPEHRQYVAWRSYVRTRLIKAGYLTYAPHEAFKGTWSDRAQAVNNAGIAAADVMLVLSPPNIATLGTDVEVEYARRVGTTIRHAPPGHFEALDKLERELSGYVGTQQRCAQRP